ncbi:MAG: RNA polymerase sigma factor [Bacteroidaceae bacterium]|nr:RNA polymerase sigma factor [Bacteroidaceae bacterium]MBR5583560.1 RNA polymerase sigma factor [Lachnospiraceae bacterium]
MNREQFTELVKREQEELRRFLLALCCGDRFMADDIAQESLVKAYLSSDSYHEEGKFTAWIYRIAYHTFVDYKRKDKRFVSLDKAGTTSSTLTADHTFHYQELYTALQELPPKERTAILLFYMKGYDIKEISLITETTESAVKKQLSRGREHLKQKIKR